MGCCLTGDAMAVAASSNAEATWPVRMMMMMMLTSHSDGVDGKGHDKKFKQFTLQGVSLRKIQDKLPAMPVRAWRQRSLSATFLGIFKTSRAR